MRPYTAEPVDLTGGTFAASQSQAQSQAREQKAGRDGAQTWYVPEDPSTTWAVFYGTNGSDVIYGTSGDDEIYGYAGNDFLYGLGGADIIYGGGGHDVLDGGAGDDILLGGFGDDYFDGGSGYDLVSFGYADGPITVDLSFGGAQFTGEGYDVFVSIEDVEGGDFDDDLFGNSADNWINGGGGADILLGRSGDDFLVGGDGADDLDGGTGADTTDGGLGDDWHFVDNAGDVVLEAVGEGFDRVFASADFTLTAGAEIEILSTTLQAGTAAIDLTGNGFGQAVVGNAGDNILDGAGGDDRLYGNAGDDILIGGAGADRMDGGTGFDTADFSGAAGPVNVNLAAQRASGDGADVLLDIEGVVGSAFNDVIRGDGEANILAGGEGDDWLFVDGADDEVIEYAGEGFDRVFASASFVLTASAHVEILSTQLEAGTASINLTGNELGQIIAGNNGANILDGAGGDDILAGKGGNDILIGGGGSDDFDGGAGVDQVDFSGLGAAVSADLLFQTWNDGSESGEIREVEDLVGTAFSDTLRGASGSNILDGGAGDDVLDGRGGDDVTDGGLGNDWHFVSGMGDVVLEAAGEGTLDRVFASDDFVLTAGAEVEVLSTGLQSGTGAIDLTGNAFGQSVVGNDGANVLDGGAGDDALWGHGGADVLIGGAGEDVLRGGAGTDEFLFNDGNFGDDVIVDFADGLELMRIDIAGVDDFSDLSVSSNGAGQAVVTFPDGSTITLANMTAGQVDASDFVFGP